MQVIPDWGNYFVKVSGGRQFEIFGVNFVLFIIFFDFIIGAIGHVTAIF